jgi:DNA repair protein RadD
MVVTHTKELIAQNEAELKGHWKEANTGIYSAGLGKRNTSAQIIFAGIQSISSKAFEFGKIDIIIVDEAHTIPRDAQTRYGKFIADTKVANPNVVVIGMTATPYRMDTGLLHEGKGAIFDGIAYCCDMKELIKQEYLVPVVSKGGVMKIDLTDVHIRAGDYDSGELAHAADDKALIKAAVKEIVDYGKARKAWLVFAAGIEHAMHIADEIETHGIKCEVITGETPKVERDTVIKNYREGKVRCIVNVGVLTTGFNAPVCDLIALLMATRSTGKYVQIVGRGMRTYPGKKNCLLLDYGNNVVTHGVIDDVNPIRTRNVWNVVSTAPSIKECPNCHSLIYKRATECPVCDFAFPVVAPHGAEAYAGAVMTDQKQPFYVDITDVWYSRHKKPGKPDILRIGLIQDVEREYPLWCCLGHDGYAKEKAAQIVKQFGGSAKTVDEALKESQYWRKPIRARVIQKGKFYEVTGIEFSKAQPKPTTLDAFA